MPALTAGFAMEEVLDKSDKNLDKSDKNQPAFTGFGAEWRPSNLTPSEARAATSWVEAKIDRRSMLTNKDRVADIRDAMWQLEKDGEILVHRIDEWYVAVAGAYSLWLGEAHPRHQLAAPTSCADSAATSPVIVQRDVADEEA